MKRWQFCLGLAAGSLWVQSTGLTAGEMNAGDILACDPFEESALMVVDPATGDKRVLSDLDDPSQGPLAEFPWDIAVDSGGTIALLNRGASVSTLFWVDPLTGQRSVLSDLTDPDLGPTATSALAVAATADDSFVLALTFPEEILVRVDRVTGQRTIISDFTDPSQGVLGCPFDVVQLPSGDYLVTVARSDTATAAVLRVEAASGQRSVLADFGESGSEGFSLSGIILDDDGQALVLRSAAVTCRSEIYRVDPITGNRVLISDEIPISANDLAVERDGRLLTAGIFGGFCGDVFRRLYRVDPDVGDVTPLAEEINSGLAVATAPIFGTGFESGDLSRWSAVNP